MERALKLGLLTAFEWIVLLVLWMAFVSQWKMSEFLFGVLFATIGAVADAVVKKEGLAKFKPKLKWLLLIFWEPWYALDGTWATLKAIAKKLAGKKSEAQFKVDSFDAPGLDAESAAK